MIHFNAPSELEYHQIYFYNPVEMSKDIFSYKDGIPEDIRDTVHKFSRRMKRAKRDVLQGEPIENRNQLFQKITDRIVTFLKELTPSLGICVPETITDIKAVTLMGSSVRGKRARDIDLRFIYDNPNVDIRTDVRLVTNTLHVYGRHVDAKATGLFCGESGEDDTLPWILQPHIVLLAPNLSHQEYHVAKQHAIHWLRNNSSAVKLQIDETIKNRRIASRRFISH